MLKHASIWLLVLLFIATNGDAHQITGTDIATLTQLQVDHNRITGSYELQYGELSALDERRRMDTDGDDRISATEQETYIAQRRDALNSNLSLEVDGQPLPVQLENGELLPDEPLVAPAQMTLRFQLAAQEAEFTQRHTLVFRDANSFPRLVHADISVEGMPLVDIDQAVPRQGALKQIRIQAPDGPVEAAVALEPSELLWQSGAFAGGQDLPGAASTTAEQVSSSTDRLKDMLRSDELSFGMIVFALALSIFLGALHALEPGHGKTIVAAYLIGSRGTVANAIFLGGVVTFTHTFSVIVLGVITLFASRYILPEQIFPWLGASSGLLIMGLGTWLFVRNLKGKGHGHSHGPFGSHQHLPAGHAHEEDPDHEPAHSHPHPHEHETDTNHHHPHDHDHESTREHPHDHDHDEHEHTHEDEYPLAHEHGHPHDHDEDEHEHSHEHESAHDHSHEHEHSREPQSEPSHDHGDEHGHGHSHVPQGEVTLGSLLALGISGGIVPCPGALVILLLAVALHRIVFGLTLIISFSLGLAAILIAIGILMVKARPLMERFTGEGRLIRILPVVSSVVIIGVGFAMAVRSLMEAGIVIINL